MKTIVNSVHIPATGGHWHHFIVTRERLTDEREDRIRIAYELRDSDGKQIATDLSVDACAVAAWELSPDAYKAFSRQLAAGWRGSAGTLPAQF